jgi:hypothetical protein
MLWRGLQQGPHGTLVEVHECRLKLKKISVGDASIDCGGDELPRRDEHRGVQLSLVLGREGQSRVLVESLGDVLTELYQSLDHPHRGGCKQLVVIRVSHREHSGATQGDEEPQ